MPPWGFGSKEKEEGGGFELGLAFTADLEQVPLKGIKMPVALSLKEVHFTFILIPQLQLLNLKPCFLN
jgi:hypothetical protein